MDGVCAGPLAKGCAGPGRVHPRSMHDCCQRPVLDNPARPVIVRYLLERPWKAQGTEMHEDVWRCPAASPCMIACHAFLGKNRQICLQGKDLEDMLRW
jgi:hypothetical protein